MMKSQIQLASLDLFWFGHLQRVIEREFPTELLSTWSLLRAAPNPGTASQNAWVLHYLLTCYKRFHFLQMQNRSYHVLCLAFDRWLETRLVRDSSLLIFLSGFGLHSMQKFQSWGKPVVVESGSTHTDFQHRIVFEEFRKNGINYPLFPENYRHRLREEFKLADFIQIPSSFVKQTYVNEGVAEGKLHLAPYGADVACFSPKPAIEEDGIFRVICPSGVNLRKGARILAQAWKQLGWKDAELHWIGRPSPETEHLFQDPIPGLVWQDWMPHSEMSSLLRKCDALVLPSFEEGFARVLVEAAASGLALIATPNTGVEDFFSPNDPEGWLIECGSVDSLCEALKDARKQREKTFSAGQRAAQRARTSFSWEHYGEKVRANVRLFLNQEYHV